MGVSPLLTEVSRKVLSAPLPALDSGRVLPPLVPRNGLCPALCPCPEPAPASSDKMRAWIPPQPSHPETLDSSFQLGSTSLPPLKDLKHFHPSLTSEPGTLPTDFNGNIHLSSLSFSACCSKYPGTYHSLNQAAPPGAQPLSVPHCQAPKLCPKFVLACGVHILTQHQLSWLRTGGVSGSN